MTGPDGQVQILDGLAAGDRIVVHSEGTLKPDAAITIVDSLSGVRK